MSSGQPQEDLVPPQFQDTPPPDLQSPSPQEVQAPPQEHEPQPQESHQEDEAAIEAQEPQPVIYAAAEAVTCVLPSPRMTPKKIPTKRKKCHAVSKKLAAAAEQKLAYLRENFRPVPFPGPVAALDLSKHEPLFRSLGLWDFAHLPLDRDLRRDLLADLIAYYDPAPARRCSTVKGARIAVGRAELAHALALPTKKEKAASFAGDSNMDSYSRDELASLIEDFMSNFMLFQFRDDDDDDACILPPEIAAVHQMVKEGQLQKVDWAGLMWNLVERELLEVPKTGHCYYASHMQQLIKHQKRWLIQEVEAESKPEPFPEEEASADVTMADEEDEAEDDAEVGSDNIQTMDEINNMGLSLGLGGEADVMNGSGRCSEREEEHWIPEDKNEGMEHCLRRCNLNIGGSMEFENLCREDGEAKAAERYPDDLCAKFGSLERLTSSDLLQTMDAIHTPYNQPESSLHLSSGEFLAMRDDAHRNSALEPGRGGSFCFGNNGKRNIGEIDDDDDDDEEEDAENIHRYPQSNMQKRMRSNGLWEHPQSEFYALMEQSESFHAKAKMIFSQKEEECMNGQMQVHYLTEILQQKDQFIESLEKTRMEEQHKWEAKVGRYEHELNIMENLVVGYKKALKHTRTAFAEYRKKFPQGDEPLYKDVEGGGGLVLTASELERRRLEKEEEMFREAKLKIHDFASSWYSKLEQCASSVMVLNGRLGKLFEEFDLLKERFGKMKESDA